MICPGMTENDTSSTALTMPARVANCVLRLLTLSVGWVEVGWLIVSAGVD